MMHQILTIKNSSILARRTESSILARLPYAKGSERPKPALKDFKEPLDGRTHHHYSSVMKNFWPLPCGKVQTIEKPAGWNWGNWKEKREIRDSHQKWTLIELKGKPMGTIFWNLSMFMIGY